jgi:hypothetical protein
MSSAHDGGKGLACPHLDFVFGFFAAGAGAATATGGGGSFSTPNNISRLIVQNNGQQRVVDFQGAVVFNQAQLSKFVHEMLIHPLIF